MTGFIENALKCLLGIRAAIEFVYAAPFNDEPVICCIVVDIDTGRLIAGDVELILTAVVGVISFDKQVVGSR
jgi:hypothetical protein